MPNATVRANARSLPPASKLRPALEYEFGLRARLAEAAEKIIAALDALDDDPDVEDTHDAEAFADDEEPSLGSTNALAQGEAWQANFHGDDLEFEGDTVAECDLEDTHDQEDDPAESGIGDDDGYREQFTGEPSLGSKHDVDQSLAWGTDGLAGVFDGEATGTVDDLASALTPEDHAANCAAAAAADSQLRRMIRHRRANVS